MHYYEALMVNELKGLHVTVSPDWRASHVQALVRRGDNNLEGKIAECVDGTLVYIVYGGGEKYKLKRWDDKTFYWTPTKRAKKCTQMEVPWTAVQNATSEAA